MMKVDYDALEEAIAGDPEALDEAFIWEESEQGYEYWYNQFMGYEPIDTRALNEFQKRYRRKTDCSIIDYHKGR